MANAANKYVYFFGQGKADGKSELRALLGGKGANLAEMTNIESAARDRWTAVDRYITDLLVPGDPALDAALVDSDDARLPPIAARNR